MQPVGVRETWRSLFEKCVLKVTGSEATNACQNDPLCSGLKAEIGGAVHKVRPIWDANFSTDDYGFLLVYTKNAFSKINHIGILWEVHHLWPSGARFFNCFCYWTSFVLKNGNGEAIFLYNREGVTQGNPLSMLAYGIYVLPMIKHPKE